MTKIENEDKFVKRIGAEMVTQSNRSTQYPMFVVMTDRRIYMPHSFGWDYDGKERKSEEYQEIDERDLCEACRKLRKAEQELPDDCSECDADAFNWYKLEDNIEQMPGVFFTAKAAEQHIKENRYHYTNPRVYGIPAWRNPETEAVMRHLIKLAGKDVPNWYA